MEFLESQPMVLEMAEDIRSYVEKWLPSFIADNRSYLTVAIGCTGGQHRPSILWKGSPAISAPMVMCW